MEQDYDKVIAFANSNGLKVTRIHILNRLLLDVNGSVADIEKALHVTMLEYQHPIESRKFYSPDVEPSLDLAVPVLHISGLDNFIIPKPLSHLRRPGKVRRRRLRKPAPDQGEPLREMIFAPHMLPA